MSGCVVAKKSVHHIELDLEWTDWSPYISMVEDGEVELGEMLEAHDDICAEIVAAAASGDPFRHSYSRMTRKMAEYGRLGFCDSEGTALLDEICRYVWGGDAIAWIGESYE